MALSSGSFDLRNVFLRLRQEMLADAHTARLLGHTTAIGQASEQSWFALLEKFLPGRFRLTTGFVVDQNGNRSRQTDILIYDGLHASPLFPQTGATHLPVESVYAAIEVKASVSLRDIDDTVAKAEVLRGLESGGRMITCLVGAASKTDKPEIPASCVEGLTHSGLDLCCLLQHGAYDRSGATFSTAEDSLAFFVTRLLRRLQKLPPSPPVDLARYLR